MFAFPLFARTIPKAGSTETRRRLVYKGGSGTLRQSLEACTKQGFTVSALSVEQTGEPNDDAANVTLRLLGASDPTLLTEKLRSIDGSLSVYLSDTDDQLDQASDS